MYNIYLALLNGSTFAILLIGHLVGYYNISSLYQVFVVCVFCLWRLLECDFLGVCIKFPGV